MLKAFFLKRFYYQFLLYFCLISGLLSSSNLFIRLPIISNAALIPQIFFAMLPLIALFSLPISACIAVQNVLGKLIANDNLLMVNFMRGARKELHRAVIFFSVSITFLFIPLVFYWGPQSYSVGKRMLISFATDHLQQLEPDRFHEPLDRVTFYYKRKIHDRFQSPYFENLLLVIATDQSERYFFTAQTGKISHSELTMNQGSLLFLSPKRSYVSSFDDVSVDLDQLLSTNKSSPTLIDPKFSSLNQLLDSFQQLSSIIEFMKRCSQIIWQLLLPFLALFLMMIFGRRKNNMLLSVLLSGTLFVFQYMVLTCAQALSRTSLLAGCLLFFVLPLTLLVGFMVWYHQTQ